MKILVDDNIPYAKVLFERFGEVEMLTNKEMLLPARLRKADALMVRSVTRVDSALLHGSQVKFVGTVTAGTDHVDEKWLAQTGIHFSAAPGCNAIAVVEYVFSSLFFLSQRDNFTLRDKTVGIVGAGNVGACLYRRLSALGVNTMLCDPPLAESGMPGNWKSLENLIAQADILTLHTPLIRTGRHATLHLLNERLLAALPANRILINTCRGAVVDTVALLQALKGGKALSVVLDVWEEDDPLVAEQLLAHVDISTSHIAGYTLEGRARGTIQIFNSYSNFLGRTERVTMADVFLPPPPIEYIRLRGTIDEEMLRVLMHLVYDIRRDDMELRRIINQSDKVDRLRKHYSHRREWSSLLVESDNVAGTELLCALGFRVRQCSCIN